MIPPFTGTMYVLAEEGRGGPHGNEGKEERGTLLALVAVKQVAVAAGTTQVG